ncbi:MAG TPA: ATP-binding protein [Planctomycetaceae bacterium]|nr:ATP-binding protein [Planctomycetaceae bacterium]
MTLTSRLLVFSLSMLAFVLISFSSALYFLADRYLHQQSQERLETVLNTIGAAIETDSEGVEWEPMDHQQSLDFSTFNDHVAWFVTDSRGQIVARSNGSATDAFHKATNSSQQSKEADRESRRWIVGPWEAGQEWIRSDEQKTEADVKHYQALSITAGVSVLPMRATLRRLAYTLAGLFAAVLLMAFFVGRSVCRQALLPVQSMAVAAGEIDADDLTQRLPSLKSRDELDELTRSFNHMLDRLQLSFERQRRFTGDASHQLRTPLTAILGQVEVALRRDRSGEEYKQVLETVQKRTTHLSRMVESLLFLARANAEAQIPSLERLDLAVWLPQHLDKWSEHPRFREISQQITSSNPLTIYAQSALLGELLDILIDNACKYSEPGTSITIQADESESSVCVKVKDHGCGLDDDELASLFEPFFRSAETRRRGIDGIGLGLSIAKRLAEVIGGHLTVEGQKQHGSCFTLTFPKHVDT